jgi:hypothetical protein
MSFTWIRQLPRRLLRRSPAVQGGVPGGGEGDGDERDENDGGMGWIDRFGFLVQFHFTAAAKAHLAALEDEARMV